MERVRVSVSVPSSSSVGGASWLAAARLSSPGVVLFLPADSDGGPGSALPGGFLQKQPTGGEWAPAAP